VREGALRVILVFALVGSLQIPDLALGQQDTPSVSEQQKASEFYRLIEHLQKSDDPKEEIAALEAALQLESQLKVWPQGLPLKGSRPQVRATLQSSLGDSINSGTRATAPTTWRRRSPPTRQL
jgi:hypothetical protein